jgi:hypothetical protein
MAEALHQARQFSVGTAFPRLLNIACQALAPYFGPALEFFAQLFCIHLVVGQAASLGRRLKARSSVATNPARYHSVTLRHPYLTQILFADLPEEKNGSSGRTRIRVKTLFQQHRE